MTPAVRSAWAGRTAAEYRSAAVASEMLHWCIVLGVAPDLVAEVHRVVDDELNHADMSRAVHEAAGGLPTDVVIARESLSLTICPTETLERRALAAAFQEFAVHETVALECFREMRKHALVPIVRSTVDRIARDEARHRRVGWRLVESLLAQTGERKWLQTMVAPAVDGVLLAYGTRHAPTAEDLRWGLLDPDAYLRAVRRARAGPIARELASNILYF